MESRIQYAKTNDGVHLAYFVLGEGQPLVLMPSPPISHVGKAVTVPSLWSFMEGLAGISRLVVYDGRGFGLSDRDDPDFSIETQILDLEAVAAQLGLERFALLAHFDSTPAAIAYAARNRARLTHLLLWSGYATGAEQTRTGEFEAMIALMDKDWQVFTQVIANLAMGPSAADEVARFAEFVRACAKPAAFQKAWRVAAEFDVRDLLPQLQVPTLVMDRQGSLGAELSRKLVSSIPGAELCMLASAGIAEWAGDIPAVVSAIQRFLGPVSTAGPDDAAPATVRTILFTDIEGSTAMTQRLGDAAAREVLREHERITRECLREHGGSEVKTMGDGFMAAFGSAVRALECAIAVQQAFAEWNAGVGAALAPPQGAASSAPTEPIRVRIGLNAGEPIAEDDPDGRGDLFGTAVIRAARIAALAQGGEILVANVVRELAEGKGFMFGDRGEVALRGFDDPVRLFEVRWQPPSTELRTGFDSPADAGGSG